MVLSEQLEKDWSKPVNAGCFTVYTRCPDCQWCCCLRCASADPGGVPLHLNGCLKNPLNKSLPYDEEGL